MIIIPARLASTRFPNKILCDIGGVPMFVKSALNASKIDEVVVALDSKEAYDIACKYNIKAVMTDSNIPNGSLRVLEASKILGLSDNEIIINLQADEPFLEKEVILSLKDSMKEAEFMATCAKRIDKEAANNPNIVKVILNDYSEAIYFSRSIIPHYRDIESRQDSMQTYLGHIGIYAYFKSSLEYLSKAKECALENIEKLEQLRAIYYKNPIKVSIVESESIGIDTKEDLDRARNKYGF